MDIKTEETTLLICDADYQHLLSLIAAYPQESLEPLREELAKARIIPKAEFPSNVVRLYSKVLVVDLNTNKESQLTLVLPYEADIASGKVSILAPMGTALIGLKVDQKYEWMMPKGNQKKFQVKAILDEEK